MRWLGLSAGVIVGAVDVVYPGMTGGGGPQFLRVPFVAAFLAMMAICAILSSRSSSGAWRAFLLGASTAGLLLLGLLAAFSIGAPLVLAGALTVIALLGLLSPSTSPIGARVHLVRAAAGAVLSITILMAGLEATEFALRCPTTGKESGSGLTVLGQSYQYFCDNGRLTVSP